MTAPFLRIVAGTAFADKPASPERAAQCRRSCESANGSPDDLPLAGLYSETVFRLPFVTLPAEECDSWGEFWKQTVMWNDEPTDNQCADYARGRRYACLAIEALRTERICSRQLEIIVEGMIERAFRRRGAAGKLCRRLSSSEQGFLTALCRVAVEIDLPKGWGRR
jgi:hypothetical protein